MLQHILANLFPLQINPALVFGLVLIIGVFGGILASRISWLPTITGFMLVGLVMGPSLLNILNPALLLTARGFVDIALGLILFKLGGSIHPKEILSSKRTMLTSACEVILTFALVYTVLHLFGLPEIVSLLVAAICVSSSPAILVHVANEVGAAGPVTRNVKSLVALNNMMSFLIFTAILPFALRADASPLDSIGLPLYRLIGSLALGTAVAFAITRLTRLLNGQSLHFRFPIIVSAILLTLGLSSAFEVSFLFAALTLGVATRWMELKYAPLAQTNFGYAEDILFIMLFVTAGANLHLSDIWAAGLVAPCLILARCGGKFIGSSFTARLYRFDARQTTARGLLLLPMAGLAIGLVQTTENFIPSISAQVAALIFATVAVLETFGPPLTKVAFEIADETGKDHPAEGNVGKH